MHLRKFTVLTDYCQPSLPPPPSNWGDIFTHAALLRIKEGIEALPPSIRVQHKDKVGKLELDERGVLIEIEVKMVVRGLLDEANKAPPCETAQAQFDAFYRNSKSQSERDDQAFY
ncbi:hypothetical protein E3W66_00725 [Gammaproteobacteria bacterium LSUCC0057]|uniref:Uncharacterized protein n=1 Tax=Gammaproteobacteria bacterium LSUCC0057 TaxID=2559237 RepID=A0A4Y8UL25_9GAMM|nr:hypothetical protein E3W66_00725 [Gammaproteobacteria bacterium LSUCC0057]